MNLSKLVAAKFVFMKVLCFAITTTFFSFILAYLEDVRSLTVSQSSLLLMLSTIGAFSGQFFFGWLCDRFHTHKRILLLIFFLVMPMALILFFSSRFAVISLFLFSLRLLPFSHLRGGGYLVFGCVPG